MSSVCKNMSSGKVVKPQDAEQLLLSVIRPGNRVVIEGDNQKQALFLAKALANLPPAEIYDLHMLMSSVTLDEHLDLFLKKIARKLDFLRHQQSHHQRPFFAITGIRSNPLPESIA